MSFGRAVYESKYIHICTNNIEYEDRPNSHVWNIRYTPRGKPRAGVNDGTFVLCDVTRQTPGMLITVKWNCPRCGQKLRKRT